MYSNKPQIATLQRAVNSIVRCVTAIIVGIIICPAIMSRVSTV
jgi:hypothetical protein